MCASAVDVAVRRVAPSSGVAIDPLEPVLCTVACDQILEVVCRGNALGLARA